MTAQKWGFLVVLCFNPCFNGSVERGAGRQCEEGDRIGVSILVLMEVLREAVLNANSAGRRKSFNPCFNGSVERGARAKKKGRAKPLGFNPCFNGSVERGLRGNDATNTIPKSFNPCFNGSVERGHFLTPGRAT